MQRCHWLIRTFLLRITHTIISQSIADSSWRYHPVCVYIYIQIPYQSFWKFVGLYSRCTGTSSNILKRVFGLKICRCVIDGITLPTLVYYTTGMANLKILMHSLHFALPICYRHNSIYGTFLTYSIENLIWIWSKICQFHSSHKANQISHRLQWLRKRCNYFFEYSLSWP